MISAIFCWTCASDISPVLPPCHTSPSRLFSSPASRLSFCSQFVSTPRSGVSSNTPPISKTIAFIDTANLLLIPLARQLFQAVNVISQHFKSIFDRLYTAHIHTRDLVYFHGRFG